MAKKLKSFSLVKATVALEQLAQNGTSAVEFVYELLKIFAGYGEGQIRRVKTGPGNLAKDGKTVLIKKLIAYRPLEFNKMGANRFDGFYDEINTMLAESKISKHSPRIYIVSDGHNILSYDPKKNDWEENRVDTLWKASAFLFPLAGIEPIEPTQEALADVKSAELMAKLFDDIRRHNDIRDPKTVHSLNVFMSRLLFCFFAEDTGLFPEHKLFTNLLSQYTEDGEDLAAFIDRAFFAMSTNDEKVLATLPSPFDRFPYVNGGLFKERFPIPKLSLRARTLILNCGEYNWEKINPDIFGSMIQAVVTPEQRAGLGMHYTSVPNIEKVIRPLFLESLLEEYLAACEEAKEKIAKKIHPDRATQRLRNLLSRLANIKFFDPACGSGNFLIITYKRLRELEINIWRALRDIANIPVLPMSNITLTQFYGIELDSFACDTATLSLWLAEHQMNVKFRDSFGVQPDTLPLKPSGQIVCGNACRLDWNTVCPHTPEDEVYIMGNPPYLGARLQDESQKEDGNIALSDIQGHNELDYIASWFWKGTKFIANSIARLAFVTTNSISQGEQVNILWPNILRKGVIIFFAYKSFKWSNNAKYNAGVTCTIIGLSSASAKKYIYSSSEKTEVPNISPYLICGENVTIGNRSVPIAKVPEMCFGSMANDGGFLLLTKEEKDKLLSLDDSCSKFIKRIYGSQEFIRDEERYCIWIEEQDKNNLPFAILNRVNKVRNVRLQSKRIATNKLASIPWRFGEVRYKPTPSIIVPSVSSERRVYFPIGFVDNNIIISNLAFAIYDAEKWLFALLTSKMHNLWVRAVGGSLETRIRYSATLCYNTFPFPKLNDNQKEELEHLTDVILDLREENAELSLGEMYNPETMPEELLEAHQELDLAVESIYRKDHFMSDEERLEHLFKLYAKMTKK